MVNRSHQAIVLKDVDKKLPRFGPYHHGPNKKNRKNESENACDACFFDVDDAARHRGFTRAMSRLRRAFAAS